MTQQPPSAARRQFGRDVAVNVLANLIAAAILYLLAVAGRYVAANLGLMMLALVFLLAAVLFLWMLRSGYLDEDKLVGRRGRPVQPGRGRPAKR
ncbi:hypothetical protein [Micromonospora sp. NBRC 101691]|uniref:hypothetical protein n=1 Tax=Micromonospora sp. NBRC 101691 TaxID=3032198 RepID=UPI0024A406FF|nr:hypothetical protein [Micromonospora sp. NBRC 101691]GLY20960.1 hypothetical protein Misp04_06920 [Micromonospora sp. NBRC 101691]